MEEIVTSIATKLGECLWDPISHHARYLFCFNTFIGDVKKAKDELEVKLADVNMRKEEAVMRTEDIMPSVKKWLEEVNAILEEVQNLQQEIEGGGNKCFNVLLKYSLAKQMEDKANKMEELESKCSFVPFAKLIPLPVGINTQSSSREVMDFKSRESTYNSLLEAIQDDKNKMVGLYGMGGSGKTTLAIEVGKKVEQLKHFDKVFKVVVSRPLDVRNIQEQIKEKTGLQFEERTDEANAKRLLIGLQSMKVLIILDDVWSDLNLQQIGIPSNENCRILLTTRLRDVCGFMRCERTFELSLLTREEARALLMMHANLTNASFKELGDVGRNIVDECEGLPIAVVTVGRALRGKGIVEWSSALSRLQNSIPLDVGESSRAPFACLELSYEYLPRSLAKQLFLLCSMFPEDHQIHTEDLIRLAKGTLKFEEIVEGIAYKMEVARNEILGSINMLLDSCLLMHTDKQACVKMHDFVRDVALWIAKKQNQAILMDRDVVSTMPVENETLKKTKAISLWNLENNFKLSKQLHCPTLEILLLHSVEGFIEDLGGIESLKVLALVTFSFEWRYCGRRIQWSMPQSILPFLKNVHTLCVRGIALDDISFLCQLEILEILDLRGSQFDELPAAIVCMKKLKLLDVFGCTIEKSPLEVIGRCLQLEELYFWDGMSVITKDFSLSGLKRYAIYDSTFGSLGQFPNDPPFVVYYDDCIEGSRALCIQGLEVSTVNKSMKGLILRANCLWLRNCRWHHSNLNSNKIKHLGVSHCPNKRFIVDNIGTNFPQTEEVFSDLITLRLEQMDSLEQVFQDSSIRCSLPKLRELYVKKCANLTTITQVTITSIPELRKLEIDCCRGLKWLFSYSLASHCPLLEELRIRDCLELESLIGEEVALGDRLPHDNPCGNETERAFLVVTEQLQNHEALTLFLRLKHIEIARSGKRKKGMFEVQDSETVEGEESIIEAQEEPLKLSSEMCSLELIELKELEYIWKGPKQSVSLHRLERVTLCKCPKLRNIFTLAIVTSLPELRTLEVSNCKEWEGIFHEESLENLSSSTIVCFLRLEKITIFECHRVRRLFSYSLASHCPSLKKITISDCSQLEGVVQAYGGEVAGHQMLFPIRNYLVLDTLPNLREIYPGYVYNHISDTIRNCPYIPTSQ